MNPFVNTEVPIHVNVIEEKYNAKFIGDLPILGIDETCAIFWQKTPPEGFDHYFGIFVREGKVCITSGKNVTQHPIYGVITKSGELLYSRYRHDFRWAKDGTAAVDGGSDYFRLIGGEEAKRVQLVPEEDRIVIKELVE